MRKFLQIVLSAVTPVLGVSFSIAVMRAVGLFPPVLAWEAWAEWIIMAALVFFSTSVLYGIAARLKDGPAGAPPDAAAS
ncbi:hypothetical protein H8N03_09380 [Ramlibacter sp. USB13]|uniref:Uncharacterized protein n=1 Tax=Ramlibacter cellulosilyticus TaxID=2764187 RepID=A0A923MQV1_9BURK|nr:hypothetical protein [Ramlibacter cellulosilyticus]MBC5783153.1 hypothetical protein [Ramlibacter cellulosilyticus]